MKTPQLTLIACLLFGFVSAAQNPPHVEIHLSVKPDRIVFSNGEFVPRFAKVLPNVLVVPAGKVVTLPAYSTWDAIEVAGTLRTDPKINTVVRVTHLQVLPGGRLDWVVPCGRRLEVVLRSVPIDTRLDPFQWGNGLLNFGHETRHGCAQAKTWTTASEDLRAGATAVTLTDVPAGWHVGDELLIPDTRQQLPYQFPDRKNAALRESRVTIAGIRGTTLTLSKPLDFDHLAIRDFEGALVLAPRVVNLTRNLVIRSEDPTATPGHTVVAGHEASWDIRFNQLVGLGRTRNVPLNSAPIDASRIGTNQAGRYTDHYHHTQGHGSKTIGNSYIGHAGVKWGVVIHETSDAVVEWNVAIDFPGACFVTEDGNEVRTTLRYNFCAFAHSGDARWDNGAPTHNLGQQCPGCEGAGFWFRGMHDSTIDGNEAWNTRFGIVWMNLPLAVGIPGNPGGAINAALPYRPVPASFADNVTAANLSAGLDYWGMKGFLAVRHISAHNFSTQVILGPITNDTGVWLRNAILLGRGESTGCVVVPKPYATSLVIEDTLIAGCTIGVMGGGGNARTIFKNVVMQNEQNFWFPTRDVPSGTLRFENITFKPLRDLPLHALTYGAQSPWVPGTPSPDISKCDQAIVNWQGTGRNYCLTNPSAPAPPPRRF